MYNSASRVHLHSDVTLCITLGNERFVSNPFKLKSRHYQSSTLIGYLVVIFQEKCTKSAAVGPVHKDLVTGFAGPTPYSAPVTGFAVPTHYSAPVTGFAVPAPVTGFAGPPPYSAPVTGFAGPTPYSVPVTGFAGPPPYSAPVTGFAGPPPYSAPVTGFAAAGPATPYQDVVATGETGTTTSSGIGYSGIPTCEIKVVVHIIITPLQIHEQDERLKAFQSIWSLPGNKMLLIGVQHYDTCDALYQVYQGFGGHYHIISYCKRI